MHPLRMAAIVVAFAFASIACAQAPAIPKTNVTTDLTDVWWPDAEPGWGIQFVHNADSVKMLSGRYTMVWDDGCQITGRFSAIAVAGRRPA